MITLKKQRGMGMLNLILVLVICAFIGKFAFTVVPMYSENYYITSGLKTLVASGQKLEEMSDTQIKAAMESYYTINNVRLEAARKLIIVRDANAVVVKIDYDTRDNLFYNIDVVLHFDNHLSSAHPTLCCAPISEPKSVINY